MDSEAGFSSVMAAAGVPAIAPSARITAFHADAGDGATVSTLAAAIDAARTRRRVDEMSGAANVQVLDQYRQRLVHAMGETFAVLKASDNLRMDFVMDGTQPSLRIIQCARSNAGSVTVLGKGKPEEGKWVVKVDGMRCGMHIRDEHLGIGDRVVLGVAEMLEQAG